MALPLCSLTSWYYCYAITLHIAKLVWHTPGIQNLNTSLRTTTRNHPNLFGFLELRMILPIKANQHMKQSKFVTWDACDSGFVNRWLKFVRDPCLATRTVRLATASLQQR